LKRNLPRLLELFLVRRRAPADDVANAREQVFEDVRAEDRQYFVICLPSTDGVVVRIM